MYEQNGKRYLRKVGSRQEVWDEVVYCTSGRLTKDDLERRPNGKIISKRRSAQGKERYKTKIPFLDSYRRTKARLAWAATRDDDTKQGTPGAVSDQAS